TGLEPSSALIRSTTSIANYLFSFCRSASSASRRHCSSALIDSQRPISSPVRRQPMHKPCASRVHTLIHGDGGRSSSLSERGFTRIHHSPFTIPAARAAPSVSAITGVRCIVGVRRLFFTRLGRRPLH